MFLISLGPFYFCFVTNSKFCSVQGILGTPSQLSNKLPSYSEPSIGAADFLEKFPGMARLSSQSFLDSHSISPVDSETSGFSSGSDHLSDLLVRVFFLFSYHHKLVFCSLMALASVLLTGDLHIMKWLSCSSRFKRYEQIIMFHYSNRI